MILALSEGSWGTIGVIGIALLLFAIKALIYKITSPLKTSQTEVERKMDLLEHDRKRDKEESDRRFKSLEDSNKEVLIQLGALPATILVSFKEAMKDQERLYDLKYTHQKKQ